MKSVASRLPRGGCCDAGPQPQAPVVKQDSKYHSDSADMIHGALVARCYDSGANGFFGPVPFFLRYFPMQMASCPMPAATL